jgi:phosphoglycerate dehydrogenase-like enzyme
MLPPELSEPFTHKGRRFLAGFTEFDAKSERNVSPGGRSRMMHLMVEDEDAALMSEMDEVTRVKSGKVYEVKGIFLAGNGVAEIDLALAQEKPLVRTY